MPTFETVTVVTFFLVPGYLAATWFNRNTPYAELPQLQFVIQIAVWGAIMQLLALPLTIPLIQLITADPQLTRLGTAFWWSAAGTALLVIFVVPISSGLILGSITRRRGVQAWLGRVGMGVENVPTAWDFAFRPGRDPAYIRVYLKGYAPILGVLGRESLAGLSPHDHDLFLQRLVDEQFNDVPESTGVWISREQIDYVEFYG